jgi:hypothetical protein
VLIAAVTNNFDVHSGQTGAPFGARWIPPCMTNATPYQTNYLIRSYARLSDGTESGDLLETGITSEGNSGTWSDTEVLGVRVTTNRRPGYDL